MESKEQIENLEKVIGQLQGAHAEIALLARKAPSDALNAFKLKLINKIISRANEVLGEDYMPFEDFAEFEADDVPTTSDVTMVLAQYQEEAERFRSDNVANDHSVGWVYTINGKFSDVRSGPPSKVGKK